MLAPHSSIIQRPPELLSDDDLDILIAKCDPELVGLVLPRIVRETCRDDYHLMVTWLTIHDLMVIYGATQRTSFGVREIADESGLGRNELCDRYDRFTGERKKTGLIRTLADRELLAIVEKGSLGSGRRATATSYTIDMTTLLERSKDMVPAVLRRYSVPPPPRRSAVSPGQAQIDWRDFVPVAEAVREGKEPPDCPENGTTQAVRPENQPLPPPLPPQSQSHWHENGTGESADVARNTANHLENGSVSPHCPENGTVETPRVSHLTPAWHENGTMIPTCPENGTDAASALARNEATCPENGTTSAPWHENGTSEGEGLSRNEANRPENGTTPTHSLSRFRDEVREKESKKESEREKEGALTQFIHTTIEQQLAAALSPLTQLLPHLQQLLATSSPHAETPVAEPQAYPGEPVPSAPEGEIAVDAGPETTWQALVGVPLSPREQTQVRAFARSLDTASDGYGAYWLVRVMITCSFSAERLTPSYLRRVVQRLQTHGCSSAVLEADTTKKQRSLSSGPERPETAPDSDIPAEALDWQQPALEAYHAVYGARLNAIQARSITELVRDLDVWRTVLADWQGHAWRPESVPKMLDRYAKAVQESAAQQVTQSLGTLAVVPIEVVASYPGLAPEERQKWYRRLSYAQDKAAQQRVFHEFCTAHPDVLEARSSL